MAEEAELEEKVVVFQVETMQSMVLMVVEVPV
jgi:hypothetical protein